MNIICEIRKEYGGWLVEAVTPDGSPIRAYCETLGQATHEARYMECEPA